jgi:5,10-methylenetetrahydrofolate reductase
MRLREALESGQFGITAEIGPPKGVDVTEMLETAEIIAPRVHSLNVTDNQSAVMRMSSLAGCALLKNHGLEPILQMTCRDRNRIGLQADLLGSYALGVDTVLALTGDHTTLGDHPQAKPVFDLESVQLLEVIRTLNSGVDMAGKELDGTPDFFPGAVVTPEADPIEPQLHKFRKKVRAGARFFQTQAVYDAEHFKAFAEDARTTGAAIMAGVLLLRSAGMARFMNRNIAGVSVPQAHIDRLAASDDPTATGIEIAAEFIRAVKDHCDGVHVMAVGAERRVVDILDAAGL